MESVLDTCYGEYAVGESDNSGAVIAVLNRRVVALEAAIRLAIPDLQSPTKSVRTRGIKRLQNVLLVQ